MSAALAGQRLAVAAVALYVALAVLVAVPPTSWLALLVVPGVGLLGSGIRTNRAVLVGAALALVAGGWTVRQVLAGGPAGGSVSAGRGLAALVLGVGLIAVAELARLAVDAGPRRGPVRVEAALRRRTLRQDGAVAGLGLLAGCFVLALTGPGRPDRPPSVLLPLGVLAVAGVVGLVTVVVRLASVSIPGEHRPAAHRSGERQPGERQPGERAGRSASPTGRPGRWGAPRRRAQLLAGVVVVGALALPALAALAARAPLPARSADGATGPGTGPPTEVGQDGGLGAAEPPPPDDTADAGDEPAPPWAVLGALAVLGGVALLFLGREQLVSADDLRPDVAPPDDLLVGAPSAPDVRALPPELVVALLEDALRYLRADLEPRLAVRCAYAAVAGGLGRHELSRWPAETELEFLGRQLDLLADPASGDQATDAPQRALTRLTDLFEVARFSDQPIDDSMRAEALAAVEALLASGRSPGRSVEGGAVRAMER